MTIHGVDGGSADAASRPLSEIKAELFKALGHAGRVRALEVLSERERSVTELVPLVGLEASHLSQQLGVLRRAGLVVARREGSTVTYSLANGDVAELLAVAKRFLIGSLSVSEELLVGLRGSAERALSGR
jgi:DNA-binding transcriptional ArsR family regulator